MTDFTNFSLAAPILKALEEEGYTTPTPIQTQAIPVVMSGADLLGIAQTGTGKTAAFALPILHRLATDQRPAPHKGCRVLVLSPTRELASQIADSFRAYGRHLGIRVAVVFGGVGHRPQIQALSRGVDVLVATPGRLIDHMEGRAIDLKTTEILVLDEADQMLDLGFIRPIRQITSRLPSRRQNLFFSATMPKEIAGLADDILREPVKIAVTPVASTVDRVNQRVILIENSRKREVLAELLKGPDISRSLVFTRTKRGADRVAEHLEAAGLSVASIHGNKSQRQREIALDSFRKGEITVLVATDIAARGIDVDDVSHVVNYELPEVPEAYVHRIGRTARAGAQGSAISLCDNQERDLLRAIERLTKRTIESEDRRNPNARAPERDAPRERNGHRGSGDRSQQRHRPSAGAHRNGASRDGGRDASGHRGDGRSTRPDEASRGENHRNGRSSQDRRGHSGSRMSELSPAYISGRVAERSSPRPAGMKSGSGRPAR